MRTLVPLAVALATFAATAAAQQSINETRPAAAAGTVEIENVSGSVRVTTWNRNEVQVTGRLGRGAERLDFTTQGDRTRIRVVLPSQGRNVQGSDLEIRIPVRSSPIVETVSADIRISGARGAVQAKSVSGGIEVAAAGAPTLQASSVSGTVRLTGSSGSVEAESVSGDLQVAVASRQTRAKTASGSIALRELSGAAEASTVSGNTVVEGGQFERLTLNSVSGGVRFRGQLTRGGMYHVTSHSGNVELQLPARVAADFEVSTFSGRVVNDFGPQAQRTSRYTPGRELRFSTGDGSARVVAKTFSGNVRLVRQ